MALEDQDWQLPQLESINLIDEELMLLDWILCSASGLIPGATVDDLMERWSSVRFDIWKGINDLKKLLPKSNNYELKSIFVISLLAFFKNLLCI